MKILIVDDVSVMLMSLKQLLERNGYQVTAALNGKEALQSLSTDFTIDVVITDLVMPEMSGVDLYRRTQMIQRVSDKGEIPPPPFILLTSYDTSNLSSSRKSELEEARQSFAAILHKPVEGVEILPLLEKIKYQRTNASREATRLRSILQDSLAQLGQTSSRGNETAVVQRLLQQLAEFQTESLVSDNAESSTSENRESVAPAVP